MVDFTSDTLSGDIRRCILKKKMDLGNIGGFRVPKKALFSGFQPFFGHFKGPEWCQTKIPDHATPAKQSPTIAERICGFWFQGSFVQIMAHCALFVDPAGRLCRQVGHDVTLGLQLWQMMCPEEQLEMGRLRGME